MAEVILDGRGIILQQSVGISERVAGLQITLIRRKLNQGISYKRRFLIVLCLFSKINSDFFIIPVCWKKKKKISVLSLKIMYSTDVKKKNNVIIYLSIFIPNSFNLSMSQYSYFPLEFIVFFHRSTQHICISS